MASFTGDFEETESAILLGPEGEGFSQFNDLVSDSVISSSDHGDDDEADVDERAEESSLASVITLPPVPGNKAELEKCIAELRDLTSFNPADRVDELVMRIMINPLFPGSLLKIDNHKFVVHQPTFVAGRINPYIFIPRRGSAPRGYECDKEENLVLSLSIGSGGNPMQDEDIQKMTARFGGKSTLKAYQGCNTAGI